MKHRRTKITLEATEITIFRSSRSNLQQRCPHCGKLISDAIEMDEGALKVAEQRAGPHPCIETIEAYSVNEVDQIETRQTTDKKIGD